MAPAEKLVIIYYPAEPNEFFNKNSNHNDGDSVIYAEKHDKNWKKNDNKISQNFKRWLFL
jgi:hypothetical protein